jgi:hypothetical protein
MKYAWSEPDKRFYVFVTAGKLKGWIDIDNLNFTPPPSGSIAPTP